MTLTSRNIEATNVDPASTAPKNVLSDCFVLPKGAIYDGGAEVVTSLEFPPFKNG